jgi:hypothetical protein
MEVVVINITVHDNTARLIMLPTLRILSLPDEVEVEQTSPPRIALLISQHHPAEGSKVAGEM